MNSHPTKPDAGESIFRVGENCWRVEQADKLALIVDAAEYFRTLRKVFMSARREVLLIGWDFDFEIEMLPGEGDANGLAHDGLPNRLGPFLEAIAEKSPRLNIYMLKWNGAVLVAPGRILPTAALDLFGSDRIHFALDGHHPIGACHHQKIVVVDDAIAFCGGIDATEDRWDTSDHLPNDPRRVRGDGSPSQPWHDATSALSGPVAQALADLSRMRWHRATGEKLKRPDGLSPPNWPDELEVSAENIEVAIARTAPPFDDKDLTNETERLCLDGIAAAQKIIYIESQYFAAETICEAIEGRLRQNSGPEIVVINPEAAQSELEDEAMHVLRGRMIERLKAADHEDRFRIFYPVTTAGEPIYVHAKIFVVDDRLLRIGSSNLNDRSLGFDTECDVAFEGPAAGVIERFRTRLLAEHLGVSSDTFEDTFARSGSLIQAIETLNSPRGRGLRAIRQQPENMLGGFLADTRLLDPRYLSGQVTAAGKGIRPRHLALIFGAAGIGMLGWLAWRKWYGRPRDD